MQWRHLWITMVAKDMEMTQIGNICILVVKSLGLADGLDVKSEENE